MYKYEVLNTKSYDFTYVLKRYEFDPLFTVEVNEIKFVMYDNVISLTKTDGNVFILSNMELTEDKVNNIINIFDLEANYQKIAKSFMNTKFKELFINLPNTPILMDLSPEIAFLRAVIHQQISMRAAYSITTKMIDYIGCEIDGVKHFPSIDKLKTLTDDEYRSFGFNKSKVGYLRNTIAYLTDNKDVLEILSTKTEDEVYEELVKIKGIGKWSIRCLLIFGYGLKNINLSDDLGVINSIKKYFDLEERPSIKETDKYIGDIKDYKTYLMFNLWRVL